MTAAIRLPIRVKPGSSRLRVGGSYGEPPALIVAVHSQPVDGQANTAVIHALSEALGVRPGQISVVSGHTSRTKIVEIQTADVDAVRQLAAALLDG